MMDNEQEVKELCSVCELNERCEHVVKDYGFCSETKIILQRFINLGYHKVEPVTLKVLGDDKFKKEGCWKRMPMPVWTFGHRISQATIDQYKEQLYRRIE
jgi:hypothetical protein